MIPLIAVFAASTPRTLGLVPRCCRVVVPVTCMLWPACTAISGARTINRGFCSGKGSALRDDPNRFVNDISYHAYYDSTPSSCNRYHAKILAESPERVPRVR